MSVDPSSIATWFAPGGPIARILPGYEVRQGQIALAEALATQQPFLAEAGTGCMVGSTIIPTSDGLLTYEQLLEGRLERENAAGFQVAARTGLATTSTAWRSGPLEGWRILTKAGHEAVVSSRHLMLTLRPDGSSAWMLVRDLTRGDRVAIAVGTEVWGTTTTLPYFRPEMAPNGKRFSFPAQMNHDLASLLGVLVADGDSNGYRLRVSNARVTDWIVELGRLVWGYTDPTCRPVVGGSMAVEFNGGALCQWADALGLCWGAAQKRVPRCVASAPRDLVVAFCEGLFLDSLVTAEGKWRFSSASRAVADFVVAVLLNLGIRCRRYCEIDRREDDQLRKAGPSWQVIVEAQEAVRLLAATFQLHKPGLQARIAQQSDREPHSNVDTLVIPDLLRDLQQQNGWRRHDLGDWHYWGRGGGIRWDSVEKLLGASRPCEARERLAALWHERYFWVPVQSVEPAGTHEMYDLTVPGPESYVGNGFLNHNSGKSLAYLLAVLRSGQQAIVATYTKALQDQLYLKDLPLVERLIPGISTALLKGRHNYLCLAGETGVITRDGIRPIQALAAHGGLHTLLDGKGRWVKAEVRGFGRQRLMKLTLSRMRTSQVIYATPEHRWFLQQMVNSRREEVTTGDLRPGDRLAYQHSRAVGPWIRPSPFGVAHGITFGDGTMFAPLASGFRTATCVLHGVKRELVRFFPLSEVIEQELPEEYTERKALRVCDLPQFFKALPSLDEAPSYLYGWLAGYVATDGWVTDDGHVKLSSSRRDHLEFAQIVCLRLGIGTYGISTTTRVGIRQDEPSQVHVISLARDTLSDAFFVRSDHAELAQHGWSRKRARNGRRWKVVSVEETERVEEVYCAVVPTTQSFVLEGNILTGNCLLEFDRLQDEEVQGVLTFATRDTGPALQRLQAWVASGEADRDGGDLGALDIALPDDLRRQVTVDSRDCLGRKCGFFAQCYSQLAKAKAQEADLVVVNHALLLFDLVLSQDTAGAANLLPPAPVIVVDEAQHLPDVAIEVFGAEVTGGRWRALESRLERLQRPLLLTRSQAQALLRQVDAARTEAAAVRQGAEAWLDTLLDALGSSPAKALDAVLDADRRTTGEGLLTQTAALAETIMGLAKALAPATSEEATERWKKCAWQIERLATELQWALTPDDPDDTPLVRSVERQEGRRAPRAVLRVRPLRVDTTLQHLLWGPRQGLAVSATLASGHGPTAFDYWRGRVGVVGGVTRVIPSPFPFRTHARLYVPADGAAFDPSLPAHQSGDGLEGYRQRVLGTIEELLAVRRGGAFALFTSYRMLRYVAERLQDGQDGLRLHQGDAPPAELIRRFKADGHAVLLGTRTFWEGMDVSGEALSLVIIDRLPFAVPDDPLWEARVRDAGTRWFTELALPQTLMTLKQAFGRLLRRMDDRGVCAILDGRLRSKSYGKWLVAGLPPAKLVGELEEVKAFNASDVSRREDP